MHVQNSREVPEYEIDSSELDFSNSVHITKVILNLILLSVYGCNSLFARLSYYFWLPFTVAYIVIVLAVRSTFLCLHASLRY